MSEDQTAIDLARLAADDDLLDRIGRGDVIEDAPDPIALLAEWRAALPDRQAAITVGGSPEPPYRPHVGTLPSLETAAPAETTAFLEPAVAPETTATKAAPKAAARTTEAKATATAPTAAVKTAANATTAAPNTAARTTADKTTAAAPTAVVTTGAEATEAAPKAAAKRTGAKTAAKTTEVAPKAAANATKAAVKAAHLPKSPSAKPRSTGRAVRWLAAAAAVIAAGVGVVTLTANHSDAPSAPSYPAGPNRVAIAAAEQVLGEARISIERRDLQSARALLDRVGTLIDDVRDPAEERRLRTELDRLRALAAEPSSTTTTSTTATTRPAQVLPTTTVVPVTAGGPAKPSQVTTTTPSVPTRPGLPTLLPSVIPRFP